MNNLRDYYERALEVFGTSDEGELSKNVQQSLMRESSFKLYEHIIPVFVLFFA